MKADCTAVRLLATAQILLKMKKFYSIILVVLAVVSIAGIFACCNTDKEDIAAEMPSGNLGGHKWVDLGLSVRWATCNVGANSPEDNGDYFAWGETTKKDEYLLCNYSYFNWDGCGSQSFAKYCNSTNYSENGFSDNKAFLEISDDAAAANWGDGWRMPTKDEFQELFDKCKWVKTSNGYEVTGPNGKSIHLPLAGYRVTSEPREVGIDGYYWTNSLGEKGPSYAWRTDFGGGKMFEDCRDSGLPVRPVCKK